MASIRKRTTAQGETRYDVRYRDPSGRVRTRTFRRRKDAGRFATTTEADKARGTWIDPNAGRVTFAGYAERWVAERTTSRGRKLAPRTVELYRSQLAKHILPTFGELDLNGITVPAVRSWHAELVAAGHVAVGAKCYRLLRAILSTAVDDDLILRNPCTIKGAGVERSPERPTATAAQVWALADAIDAHLSTVVLVAAFAGLRFAEVAGLQRRHVDQLHRIIVVEQQLEVVSKATAAHLGIEKVGFGPPKSEAGYRTLSVPEPLAASLDHHLATYASPGSDGLVFVGPLGAPLHRANFGPKFAAARRAAGLPDTFRFHDLRHTHMTAAAESGASTKELMRRLGQSSPSAALRYQHATDNRDVAIADAVADRLARPRPEPRDGRAMEPERASGTQNAKAPGTHTAQGFRAESG